MDQHYLHKIDDVMGSVPQPKLINLEAPKPTVPDISTVYESHIWRPQLNNISVKENIDISEVLNVKYDSEIFSRVPKNNYDPSVYTSPVLKNESSKSILKSLDNNIPWQARTESKQADSYPSITKITENKNSNILPLVQPLSRECRTNIDTILDPTCVRLPVAHLNYHRYNIPKKQNRTPLNYDDKHIESSLDIEPKANLQQGNNVSDHQMLQKKKYEDEIESQKKTIICLQGFIEIIQSQNSQLKETQLSCHCSKKEQKIAIVQTSFEDFKPRTSTVGTNTDISSKEMNVLLDTGIHASRFFNRNKEPAQMKSQKHIPILCTVPEYQSPIEDADLTPNERMIKPSPTLFDEPNEDLDQREHCYDSTWTNIRELLKNFQVPRHQSSYEENDECEENSPLHIQEYNQPISPRIGNERRFHENVKQTSPPPIANNKLAVVPQTHEECYSPPPQRYQKRDTPPQRLQERGQIRYQSPRRECSPSPRMQDRDRRRINPREHSPSVESIAKDLKTYSISFLDPKDIRNDKIVETMIYHQHTERKIAHGMYYHKESKVTFLTKEKQRKPEQLYRGKNGIIYNERRE